MGFVRLRPRRWPNKYDEEKRRVFKEVLADLIKKKREIWFQDESGFEVDSKIRQIWARKGSRLFKPYTGSHVRENVIGAVRLSDGRFMSLIMPEVNTITFQIFIDEIQKHVKHKKEIMVLDNASWHKTKKIKWGKIEPLFLPPYSPDLNPIEKIWLNVKTSFFSMHKSLNKNQLRRRLIKALKYFSENEDICLSICGGQK